MILNSIRVGQSGVICDARERLNAARTDKKYRTGEPTVEKATWGTAYLHLVRRAYIVEST